MNKFILILFVSICGVSITLQGQHSSLLNITLADSTNLLVQEKSYISSDFSPCYYYPVYLRISEKKGISEFSFLTYKDANGNIEGGLMHMLLTWGLSPDEEEEVQHKLTSIMDTTALLMGGIPIESVSEDFEIIGDNELCEILSRSLKSKGVFPTIPGGKMAMSFMFSAADAVKVDAAMASVELWDDVALRVRYKPDKLINSSQPQYVLDAKMKDLLQNIKITK